MLTTEEQYRIRLEECNNCQHITGTANVPICGLCNCLLKMKARIKEFDCPINKWPKEDGQIFNQSLQNSVIYRSAGGCGSCGG